MKSGAVDAMVRKKSSQTSAGLETVPSKYEGIVNDAANVVNYQTMQWWHAGTVMIAETISLGILSLPKALATIGFLPGIILIVLLGIISWYTGYVVYAFKIRNPEAHSYADALALVFGKTGRWIGEIMQTLVLVFIMAAHILAFSVMMNSLTQHGACTIIWTIIGTAVSFLFTLPRTFKSNSYVSILSCASISVAIIVAMIGVAVSRPGMGDTYLVTPSTLTSFAQGTESVSNIVVAFMGHIAYPALISEMKKPTDFPKSLAMLQCSGIAFYIVVSVVIYNYAGQGVTSPALGSASPIVRKVAFGIAAPTIVVAGVINCVIAAKNMYNRYWVFKKAPQATREKSFRARGSWYIIIALLWIVSWTIAEAIPVFGHLLSFIGAAFSVWYCLGFAAVFWFCIDWNRPAKMAVEGELTSRDTGSDEREWTFRQRVVANWKRNTFWAGLNLLILAMCVVICVLGVYGSLTEMVKAGADQRPFSCTNNA